VVIRLAPTIALPAAPMEDLLITVPRQKSDPTGPHGAVAAISRAGGFAGLGPHHYDLDIQASPR